MEAVRTQPRRARAPSHAVHNSPLRAEALMDSLLPSATQVAYTSFLHHCDMFLPFFDNKDHPTINLGTRQSIFFTQFSDASDIGEGTFSKLYSAVWTLDGKRYSIKRTRYKISSDHTMLERFISEIRASSLPHSHKCLLSLKQAWVEDDYAYLQYDLCEAFVRHQVAMPEQEIWKVYKEIKAGLTHLHRYGIVHLDVKPDNILRLGSTYVLGDFGQSVTIGSAPVVSDAGYIALEVMQGLPVQPSADTFSLGLTLLELQTGLDVPESGVMWHYLRSPGFDWPGDRPSPALENLIRSMLNPVECRARLRPALFRSPRLFCSVRRRMATPFLENMSEELRRLTRTRPARVFQPVEESTRGAPPVEPASRRGGARVRTRLFAGADRDTELEDDYVLPMRRLHQRSPDPTREDGLGDRPGELEMVLSTSVASPFGGMGAACTPIACDTPTDFSAVQADGPEQPQPAAPAEPSSPRAPPSDPAAPEPSRFPMPALVDTIAIVASAMLLPLSPLSVLPLLPTLPVRPRVRYSELKHLYTDGGIPLYWAFVGLLALLTVLVLGELVPWPVVLLLSLSVGSSALGLGTWRYASIRRWISELGD
ncbi:Protein kinase domain [Carpediemonas membranifera]|uniref:Protein kinase domain n=1 Tax=Carpediemonas membranifera TaxID=201153 RepID=A0A8J6B1Y0_9EUKA|nr:Protein kinase domain [Carpediemonas membranifera]|eukprot:KAG9397520.1 Protein kinase domain [Carpediemonas membranifera]